MPTAIPTLQNLIKEKIKEKDLSRSDLVRAIGYSNISKGCRRLDSLLNTLEIPSSNFINNLLEVLYITHTDFYNSLYASLDEFNFDAARNFKPHIEIILDIQIRPFFAYLAVKNMCSIPVHSEHQNQSLQGEIETIKTICNEHIDIVLNENLYRHIVGFKYFREHNYYLKFSTDFILEDTVFVQNMPAGKVPFGNRVIDMLVGGNA